MLLLTLSLSLVMETAQNTATNAQEGEESRNMAIIPHCSRNGISSHHLGSCLTRHSRPSHAGLEIQDNTLVETATPSITNEFHSSTDIGWYGSACTFPRTIKLHTHRRPVLLADELPGRRWGHHMFDTVLIWESIRAVPSEMGLYHSCIDPCGCVHRVCRSTQLGCIHRRRGHRWLWRLQHCH